MKQPLLTRRSKRQVPRLNMASMPDLIFTVLFFFMLVTHMRQTDTKVRYELPRGTEVARLAHKQSVVYLYIGRARVYNNKVETGQRTDSSQTDMAGYELQLNNSIVDTAHFKAQDAGEAERAVYGQYQLKKETMLERLRTELTEAMTPYNRLSYEFQV